MESLLMFMLIRFAVIAAVVAVLVVVVFAIAVRLKRCGKWDDVRRNVGPVVSRVAEGYLRRARRDGRRDR